MRSDELLTDLVQVLDRHDGFAGGITRETALVEDLGMDSLSMIDLVVTVEDTCGIRVDDDEVAGFVTVGDIADYLARQSSDTAPPPASSRRTGTR